MRGIRILAFLVPILASAAYSQLDSIQRLDVACRNEDPLTSFDSLNGPYPDLSKEAKLAVLSPDGSYIAFLLNTTWVPFFYGTVVYDLAHRGILKFLPGMAWPKWHPSGRKLLTNFQLYDLDRDSVMDLPCRSDFQLEEWSPDGRYIYYSTTDGMYRSTGDGKDLTFLGTMRYGTKPLTDSTMVFLKSANVEMDYYIVYNLRSGTQDRIFQPSMTGIRRMMNVTISGNGRYAVADFDEKGGTRFNGGQYLGILDFERNTIRRVLRSQRLGNYYYPSWTAQGTIIVSYVCRVDSACTVWEVDTNGVFLRQLVGKQTLDELTEIGDVPPGVARPTIHAMYPQPGRGSIAIEYSAPGSGVIELTLFDALGRVVRSETAATAEGKQPTAVHLSVQGVRAGFYILSLRGSKGSAAWRSVIIE
jgi:hypothetical protein